MYSNTHKDLTKISTQVPFLLSQNLELQNSQNLLISNDLKPDESIIPLFSKQDKLSVNKHPNVSVESNHLSFDNNRISEKYDRIRPDPGFNYKQVSEIPRPYQPIFKHFPYFNKVQSKVFDDVLYTDNPIVVSSPTGSGKTVIFELAIVRVLIQNPPTEIKNIKIVYMAPLKVLCSERLRDWANKFKPYNLKCIEVTGDTDIDDYSSIKAANVIFTTPEKWDSVTRKWKEHSSQMKNILLFLIDEVHMVGDTERGSIIEAVISRMKCIKEVTNSSLRFIAVSATIPNPEDFASWLSSSSGDSICFNLDESYRPVPLQKVVISYNDCNPSSAYKFDLNLNYKLHGIIQQYSSKLPTIVFCSTRKGTVQAASTLQGQKRFVFNEDERQFIRDSVGNIVDCKLRELLTSGIGYHHAGLSSADRNIVEDLFKSGYLPVICATSTLAMGVNMPAHLVIVKSTLHYSGGKFREYSPSDVMQMIGRAGRPQYDTSAVSVIMTQNSTRKLYTDLINGTQVVESNFHLNLTDHLNAEIVLKTLTHIKIATQWMMSLFLYIRIGKNPSRYGLSVHATKAQIKEFLYNSVTNGINGLKELGFILLLADGSISPTDTGSLMARYCITFKTMKKFTELNGNETLNEILNTVTAADEFSDIQLRVQEKSTLNLLNKNRNGSVVRFPFKDRIKTSEMKISILIQAVLGCIEINDFSLNQESIRIVQVAARLSKCLFELQNQIPSFNAYVNCLLFTKCLNCKLWENSKFLARQFKNVGPILGNSLANVGITSLPKIIETDPRELELITNKNPPFGSALIELASCVPQYDLFVQQIGELDAKKASLQVVIKPKYNKEPTFNSTTSLIIGTPENVLLFKQKLKDKNIIEDQSFQCEVVVYRALENQSVIFWLVSHSYVGADLKSKFSPKFKNDIAFITNNFTSTSNNSSLPRKEAANPYKRHQNPYADKSEVHYSKIDKKLSESSHIISQKRDNEDMLCLSSIKPLNDQFSDIDDDLPEIDFKIQDILQPIPKSNDNRPIPSTASSTLNSINDTKLHAVKPILKNSISKIGSSDIAETHLQNHATNNYLNNMVQEMEDSGYFDDFDNKNCFDFGVDDLLADGCEKNKIEVSKRTCKSDASLLDANLITSCTNVSKEKPFQIMNLSDDSFENDNTCKIPDSTAKSIITNNVIRIDEKGEKFRECGHRCSDKKSCSHFCCRYGVKVKTTSKKDLAIVSSLPVNNVCYSGGTKNLSSSAIINKSCSDSYRIIKTPRIPHDQTTEYNTFLPNSDSENFSCLRNENFTQLNSSMSGYNENRVSKEMPENLSNDSDLKKFATLKNLNAGFRNERNFTSKDLKRKYVEAFSSSNDIENVPVNFEATQPPKFKSNVKFYAEAAKCNKQTSFSSIFDGIF